MSAQIALRLSYPSLYRAILDHSRRNACTSAKNCSFIIFNNDWESTPAMTESIPATFATSDEGLVFACVFDGHGGAKTIDWNGISQWTPEDGPLWIHFDRSADRTKTWLKENTSELTQRVLLEEETRPRVFATADGLIAILRGVNLNAGEDPDDMVALRLCADDNRLITVRYRPLMTPRDMFADLTQRGTGPRTSAEAFVRLTERLTERMNSVVINLDERLDSIEEQLDETDSLETRRELTAVRQSAVALRRYIGPQREALARVHIDQRYIEELDAARDRALVIRDEISNRLAEAMNERMYALSMVAGIFLPLGFLTGLLGINVGGMPGVDNSWAFLLTCLILVLVVALELYLFRRLKWI